MPCPPQKAPRPEPSRPVPGPPERSPHRHPDATARMGPAPRKLCGLVGRAEAAGLRPDALKWALRGEHILGQWHRVEPRAGGGGMGLGATVVRLPEQWLRKGPDVRALHPDSVEEHEEGRVCRGGVPQWWRHVHGL